MMRDFETYVGPDFIQPGEERLLRSYQPAQPRVNRQPETEVLVAVKEIGKPLKIVQPGTAYLGRNAVHKLQQAGCYGGPAKADVGNTEELETTIKAQATKIQELESNLALEKAKTPPVANTEQLDTTIKAQDANIKELEKTIADNKVQAEKEIQGLKNDAKQEKIKTEKQIQNLNKLLDEEKAKSASVLGPSVLQQEAVAMVASLEAVEQDVGPPSASGLLSRLGHAISTKPHDMDKLKALRSKLFDLRMIKRGGQLARVLEVSAVGADVASTMSIARSLVKERQGVDVQSQAVGAAKARLEAAIHKHS
eukprot:9535_1